ncbi:MAG: hypothetical protein N2053_04130, partial [Chitinispirillaceae bacterium]|nr:hypothetical protein [Chitinispirillaceae bacterium]
MKTYFFITLFCLLTSIFSKEIIKVEELNIARVWAGHPVNFAIKTVKDFQCVAYYDTARQMCVAARKVGSS